MPASSVRLFVTGICLMFLQFLLLRELTALLYGVEIVVTLLLMGYFGGQSLAYYVARFWRPAWTVPCLFVSLLVSLTFPFSLRLGVSILWHEGLRGGLMVAALLAAFVFTWPFSILLPLYSTKDGLARSYRAEVAGAVVGLLLVGAASRGGNLWLIEGYLASFLLLVVLVSGRWWPLLASVLLVGYGWAFPVMDDLTNDVFYASTHGMGKPRCLMSRYSPYQKVDVMYDGRFGQTWLYIDGFRYFDPLFYGIYDAVLARIPVQAVATDRKLDNVLVIGSGSLTTSRTLLDLAQHVTTVELDPVVLDAGLQYFQRDTALKDARQSGQWTVVIDDARHYLRTTPQRFDAIILDVPAPHTMQLGALHTEEFYSLCAKHLTDNGICCTGLCDRLAADNGIARAIGAAARHVFINYVVVESSLGSVFYGSLRPGVLRHEALRSASLLNGVPIQVRPIPEVEGLLQGVAPMTMDNLTVVTARNRAFWDVYGRWSVARP